jgi:hypothetical protein
VGTSGVGVVVGSVAASSSFLQLDNKIRDIAIPEKRDVYFINFIGWSYLTHGFERERRGKGYSIDFRVWGLGFGVWGWGLGVGGLEFGVGGLGFGVGGFGFGVCPCLNDVDRFFRT